MQTPNLPLPSGTITFLFTDVQGSTTLWEREPAAMQKATERHNAILHAAVANHGGSVFKIVGDGFQAAFPLPLQALQAALDAQQALAAATWETTEPLCVRMGLHSGPAEVSGTDYATSHTLNRVARICSAGHGGQVLLSLATEELLRGHLSVPVTVKDMGEHFLKGLTQPERIFQVVAPGLLANFPPLVTESRPGPARRMPLLLTKLHIPAARPGWVGRPRLFARLDQVSGGQTALLSAPAGYGKTALLAQWIASRTISLAEGGRTFAWLALDEADNDPVRFWSYLVAALQTCPEAGSLGSGFLEMVQAPQAPALEQSLVLLLNEIEQVPGRLGVVLDDYHTITEKPVHASLGFFIEHLPSNLVLILAGRGEPPLALARYRMRGRLVDLHAADLRFNNQETGEFFKTSMPLGLSESDIVILDQRVEGWVAGLQLAALSMEGLADRQSFIQSFTGDDRYILDYLTQEILSRQPPEIQDFLLKTSILERMNAGLCEELTGGQVPLPGMAAQGGAPGGAQAILEFLDRANLFITPLDNRRTWYRYHRLFADLLQVQLRQKDPAALQALHRRAGDWFTAHGLPAEAFQHAIQSGDLEKSAILLGEQLPELVQHGETATLQAWLGMFPQASLMSRPELCLASAWAALYRVKFDEVELWAQRAMGALSHMPATFSDLQIEEYHGQLDALRATVAINLNHFEQAIDMSESALRKLSGNTDTLRSLLYLNLGDAYSSRGDFPSAVRAFQDGLEVCRKIENHTLDVIIIGSLGNLYLRGGHLHQAEAILLQSLMVEKDQVAGGGPPLLACGKPLASLAQIYIEWNQAAEARLTVDKALDYCQKWQHPSHLLDCWLALANLKELEGHPEAGLAALERAREHVRQLARATDNRAPIRDYQAHIDLIEIYLRMHMGDFSMAEKWQPGNLSGNIYEMNLQALIDIQHGETAPAIELAKKILETAAKTNWLRFQVEGHALLGMVYQKVGNPGEARQEIWQALELAEPEGFVRLFLEKGLFMQQLLENVRDEPEKTGRRSGALPGYIDRLLAAFSPGEPERSAPVVSQGANTLTEPEDDLPTPLSVRERQILRLLAGSLSNDDIASRLFLSTNTVKTHLKRIFEKMGVNSRLEAVEKARRAKII
jgi:LuxR family transcriptional regulator, maltose regulon positive regulatory protein